MTFSKEKGGAVSASKWKSWRESQVKLVPKPDVLLLCNQASLLPFIAYSWLHVITYQLLILIKVQSLVHGMNFCHFFPRDYESLKRGILVHLCCYQDIPKIK